MFRRKKKKAYNIAGHIEERKVIMSKCLKEFVTVKSQYLFYKYVVDFNIPYFSFKLLFS